MVSSEETEVNLTQLVKGSKIANKLTTTNQQEPKNNNSATHFIPMVPNCQQSIL